MQHNFETSVMVLGSCNGLDSPLLPGILFPMVSEVVQFFLIPRTGCHNVASQQLLWPSSVCRNNSSTVNIFGFYMVGQAIAVRHYDSFRNAFRTVDV